MLLLLDFYLRASLEVTTLLSKLMRGKLDDIDDNRLALLWGVYSREPTLAIVNRVIDAFGAEEKLQAVPAHLQPGAEKIHNMAWKLISKLAKARLIHREHFVAYWPEAVRQVSTLFGMTSSERLSTLVNFLSTLTHLKAEDLPLADKISIVELVLLKVREQMQVQPG